MTMTRKHLKKPSQIPTWAPNGVNGWYLGPEPLHYICHTTYITETGGGRILDTVHFLTSIIEMPTTNSVDQIFQAAKDITTASTTKNKHNRRHSPTSEGASTNKQKSHKGAHPVISEGANDEQTSNITSNSLHRKVTGHATAYSLV